jgi:hypothetical protein
MRFHFGNAPEGQAPALLAEGWREIPALGARHAQNYGLLTAIAGMLLVGILLGGAFRPSHIWTAILVLLFTVPVHELIHALTTPAWGLSDRTVIGFQRGKGLLLPYMYYDGSQPSWRMLLTGLSPILLLTGLPVILILCAPFNKSLRADLGFLAFFNVAVSGGDLVTFFWISAHLPLRATVKGNGWGLLWKD